MLPWFRFNRQKLNALSLNKQVIVRHNDVFFAGQLKKYSDQN